jgi:hypothetical protein
VKKRVLIEEIHLRFYVPGSLSVQKGNAVLNVMDSKHFRTQLTRSICSVISKFSALHAVQVRLAQ